MRPVVNDGGLQRHGARGEDGAVVADQADGDVPIARWREAEEDSLAAERGTRVLMLIADSNIRIITEDTGQLIRQLVLDPTRNYQPQQPRTPPANR